MGQSRQATSRSPGIIDWLKEAQFISVVVAALTYVQNRPAFYAFLVTFVGRLLLEVWRASRDQQPVSRLTARMLEKITRCLAQRDTTRRTVRVAVLAVIAAPFVAWLLWAAADDVWGRPSKMDGDINVAVVTFGDFGGSHGSASPESEAVSEWLTDFLRARFASPVIDKTIEVRGYDSVIHDGEAEALAIGNELGASLVIHGEILQGRDGIHIYPKYTLTGKASGEPTTVDVAELVGLSDLGQDIGPIKLEELTEPSGPLSLRCEVMVWFAAGLVLLLAGDDDAADMFQQTMNKMEEAGFADNEVVHFFRGKALSAGDTLDAYDAALPEFEAALAINPDYARPYIGIANYYYYKGAHYWDEELLLKAVELYAKAMSAPLSPSTPVPKAKAHWGRGNAYFVLAQVAGLEYVSLAAKEYQAVIDLSSPCGGGLGWWDPRAWGPWDSRFYTKPSYCDEMAEMARTAKKWLDSLASLTPVVRPSPTPSSAVLPSLTIPTFSDRLKTLAGRVQPPIAAAPTLAPRPRHGDASMPTSGIPSTWTGTVAASVASRYHKPLADQCICHQDAIA